METKGARERASLSFDEPSHAVATGDGDGRRCPRTTRRKVARRGEEEQVEQNPAVALFNTRDLTLRSVTAGVCCIYSPASKKTKMLNKHMAQIPRCGG